MACTSLFGPARRRTMNAVETFVEAAGRQNPAGAPQVPRRDRRNEENRDPLVEDDEDEDLDEEDVEDES